MARDLTRLLHSMLEPVNEAMRQLRWQPPADVYRTSYGWLVKFDLAGVRPEDIAVTARGERLSVQGRRRDLVVEDQGCSSYSMEITYSQFERTLELPCDLSRAHVTTDYRDGMLFVRIDCQETPS